MPRDSWLSDVDRGKRIEIHGSAHGDALAGSGLQRVSRRKRIFLTIVGIVVVAWLGFIAFSIATTSSSSEEEPTPVTGQP
jgi:hypothetical protein